MIRRLSLFGLIALGCMLVVMLLDNAEAECRRKEMDYDLHCKILCNPCKFFDNCYQPCVGNLTNADCENIEELALQFHGVCNKIRQVDACSIAANCCRTKLETCAVNLYNSVHDG